MLEGRTGKQWLHLRLGGIENITVVYTRARLVHYSLETVIYVIFWSSVNSFTFRPMSSFIVFYFDEKIDDFSQKKSEL